MEFVVPAGSPRFAFGHQGPQVPGQLQFGTYVPSPSEGGRGRRGRGQLQMPPAAPPPSRPPAAPRGGEFKESLEQAKETVESEEAAAAKAAAAAAAEPPQMTPEKLSQMEMPGAGRKNRAHEGFVKMLTELYDSDKDGRLSWPEFQTADKMRPSPTEDIKICAKESSRERCVNKFQPDRMFKSLDKNRDGYLDGKELPNYAGLLNRHMNRRTSGDVVGEDVPGFDAAWDSEEDIDDDQDDDDGQGAWRGRESSRADAKDAWKDALPQTQKPRADPDDDDYDDPAAEAKKPAKRKEELR